MKAKDKTSRWVYLFCAAIFVGLLLVSVQEYRELAPLVGTVFSAEAWDTREKAYWFRWALYGIAAVTQIFNFLVCGKDQNGALVRCGSAALFTGFSLIWIVMGAIGMAGMFEGVLWWAVLIFLLVTTVLEWRKCWQLFRG